MGNQIPWRWRQKGVVVLTYWKGASPQELSSHPVIGIKPGENSSLSNFNRIGVESGLTAVYNTGMTVTLEEAQTKLPQIIRQATAGEEVFIVSPAGGPTVKLVPIAVKGSRLAQHPDLIGSTQVFDEQALTQPLPAEDWAGLAERWSRNPFLMNLSDPADRFILATAQVMGARILSPDTIMPKYPDLTVEW
jgi:antitoxin (DNA-binding transcriptional repressor) of toxin-antitoxin stability system